MREGSWLALALVLAGCVDPGTSAGSPVDSTVVVTKPGEYVDHGNDSAYHLHDYWNGAQRLPLLDDTFQGVLGSAYADQIEVALFRPEADRVVPQGTGNLEITVQVTRHPLDRFSDPELWVRTAADNVAGFVSDIVSGETLRMPSRNESNDLPHQRLSAWWFEVRVRPGGSGLPIRFNGQVALRAESVRGDHPIPLYPGHPDRWNGTTEVLLFVVEGHFELTMADRNICSPMCLPTNHTPLAGAVVPSGYDRVEAVLTYDLDTPDRLALLYHASDSRDFRSLTPASDAGDRRTYLVRGAEPDGPYARQTLWDFALGLEGEPPAAGLDGDPRLVRGHYQLSVRVLRSP